MSEPVFQTAVQHRPVRRVWIDVIVGLAAFSWSLAVAAFSFAPELVHAAFAVAGVLTSVSVFCAVAAACQRVNVENNERIIVMVTAQHEEVLRRMRAMAEWMDGMTGTVRDMGEHLPDALRDNRWKGYADAAEDLSAQVVQLREFQTGDLSRQLHGRRG